jgi:hypothetical protein
MIERILILSSIVGVVLLGWWLLRSYQARRMDRLAAESVFAGIVPLGRPAVVAFSLPNCRDCRSRQAPAIARLQEQLGATATIQTLMADAHGELVDKLAIMTVPATAVVDANGGLRFLNQGFTDEQRLAQQLLEAGMSYDHPGRGVAAVSR